MVRTHKELIKLIPNWVDVEDDFLGLHSFGPISDISSDDKYRYRFYIGSISLTDQEAIDLYNREHFNEEFIDKL